MAERFLASLEADARAVLPEAVYRYFRQGSRDGVTAAEAAQAWDRLRFVPQVLRDVTEVDTSTTLLGTAVRAPVGVAPTTMHRAAHPDGEVAMAAGARDAGALMVVSSNAGSTFEQIGATGVAWWLQMYVTAERPASRPLVERAVEAGARAIVLTADTPLIGTKYDEGPTVWDLAEPGWLRANFPATHGQDPGDEKATDLGPQDIAWLAEVSGLPVVVKGVLQPADVRRCVDAGASAVWVSNHGGRQLDYAVATVEALPGVVEAAGPDVEVYVDGGVRCGRHVLAALALGARAAFLGRLPLYALACDGAAGVARMLRELDTELVEAMTMAGCASTSLVPPRLIAER